MTLLEQYMEVTDEQIRLFYGDGNDGTRVVIGMNGQVCRKDGRGNFKILGTREQNIRLIQDLRRNV